jgi:hypothetical protein
MDDASETHGSVALVTVSPASGIITTISYKRRCDENIRWK